MIEAIGFCSDLVDKVFEKVQLEWTFAVEFEGEL